MPASADRPLASKGSIARVPNCRAVWCPARSSKFLAFDHGYVEVESVGKKFNVFRTYLDTGTGIPSRWQAMARRRSSARLGGKAVGEKTARQALGCAAALGHLNASAGLSSPWNTKIRCRSGADTDDRCFAVFLRCDREHTCWSITK
jgi:hypothetical protein